MWRTREKENEGCEGERMNGEEVERERKREDKEGRARMVRGWRDTVNRWEAINFGLECPIAPHFVQCKFTPDANHLARALRSLPAAKTRTGKRMWCSISDNSFFFVTSVLDVTHVSSERRKIGYAAMKI